MHPNHTTNNTQKLCECGCGQPAPIAKETKTARGSVKGQPLRFIAGHNKIPRASLTECLLAYGPGGDPNECWLWKGTQGPRGYGTFKFHDKRYMVHRVSYELRHGPIPKGMLVLHKCDVRLCWNPAHLFVGDNTANVADMIAKGRQARGERSGGAKLTQADIVEIRRLRRQGITYKRIAALFGVSPSTTHDIVSRKRWAHIP